MDTKRSNKNKAMPYSLEAEQSILGCIIMDETVALELTSELKVDDFYVNANKLIFEAMQNIVKNARPIDIVTLDDELDKMGVSAECGGVRYLTEIATSVPSSANYRHYKDIVVKNSFMRKIIDAGQKIVDQTFKSDNQDQAISFAEKAIFDISTKMDTSSLKNLDESFSEVLNKFNTIQSDKNAFTGLMTGFTSLDRITNGLQKSDLVLVAARPGVGKTAFSTNMIENISVYGKGISAVFSLEMPRVQLAQRMICSVAKVSMAKALSGKLATKDWEELWKANELVSKAKIFVDDSSLITPREILSKCRRLKSRIGLDVVMIDYIQLMGGDNKKYDGRQQEVADISRNLKIMAKELNVPVIALSQLSRASESSTKPQLSHLRESGAIEQDADIVMFIHRPDKVEGNLKKVQDGEIMKDVAEIIIAKHRNGALDTISLKWIGEMTKFVNLDREGEYLEKAYGLKKSPQESDYPAGYEMPGYEEISPDRDTGQDVKETRVSGGKKKSGASNSNTTDATHNKLDSGSNNLSNIVNDNTFESLDDESGEYISSEDDPMLGT